MLHVAYKSFLNGSKSLKKLLKLFCCDLGLTSPLDRTDVNQQEQHQSLLIFPAPACFGESEGLRAWR